MIETRNEEAGFTEWVNEDIPTITRELDGRAAVLLDMQTRNVVGYRVYDAPMTDTIDVAALVAEMDRAADGYLLHPQVRHLHARIATALQSQADALAEARRELKVRDKVFCAKLTTGVCDLPDRLATAEASLATMREALGDLDAEDVRNMRDLMLKAERFYFGKALDGEDVYVASRGPSKWVVSNGGAFVIALDGQWVMEAMPSSRTEEFIAATRRTFADAVRTARSALAKEGK